MFILQPLGVSRRVWGYATPYGEQSTNSKVFNDDTIYVGKVGETGLGSQQLFILI